MTDRRQRIQKVDARSSQATVHTSPIQISEILDRIFLFLDQKTLKSVAARVCSQWLHVASRRFQHHVVVSQEDSRTWKDIPRRLSEANVLTVGRHIRREQGPGDLYQWRNMTSKLDKALALYRATKHPTKAIQTSGNINLSNARTSTDLEGLDKIKGNQSQITALILNLESWWENQEETLAVLCPSPATALRELTMDMPFTSTSISVESILNQFPSLLHLSISSYKQINISPREDSPRFQPHSPLAVGDDGNNGFSVHPLRKLYLDCLCLSPATVGSYFPRLVNLIEIRLLDIRLLSYSESSFYNSSDGNQEFWQSLARHCPKLQSIHFQMHRLEGGVVPVELFPCVNEWLFDCHLGTTHAMLRKLAVHVVENRLTTLNIDSTQKFIGGSCREFDHVSDQLLCDLLCASPHLKHLDTGVRVRSMLVLTMPVMALWACRGLLTLSMRFSMRVGGPHSESRLVFGFLSRACPVLESLSLHLECGSFSARSGLCLLTRLHRLRRLELHGVIQNHQEEEKLRWTPQKSDFCWIQERAKPASRLAVGLRWIREFPTLPFSGSLRSSSGADREKEYLDNIEKLQEWSMSPTFKGAGMNSLSQLEKDRPMIHQQQKDNGYKTDYDRLIPMVDGVEGLNHSGSYLDIEACLKAQLFRLKQHAPEMIPVWPVMEQIRFIHQTQSYYHLSARKDVQSYVEKGCKIVRRIRPDIKVLSS